MAADERHRHIKNDKNDETISSEHKQIRHAVVVFAQLLPGEASRARSPARRMFRPVPIQGPIPGIHPHREASSGMDRSVIIKSHYSIDPHITKRHIRDTLDIIKSDRSHS